MINQTLDEKLWNLLDISTSKTQLHLASTGLNRTVWESPAKQWA